jgi:hypothetical protein
LTESKQGRGRGTVRQLAWVMGILLLICGCRTRQNGDATLLERIERVGSRAEAPKPGELAEKGRAAITEECAKQTYANASKGLIVSETGLHEDVFALRDRISYGASGYGLDEAMRLESLLHAEANVGGLPKEQAQCILEFAEHMETLTDPIVDADVRQKELDLSAFDNAAKEAQEQATEKLREIEKPAEPRTQGPEQAPQNY